jgi:pyridoxal phosphate enzyme (YggS family)
MTFNVKKYLEISNLVENFSNKNNKSKVSIIAVTKTRQVEDVNEALKIGITHFGEIRVQEASKKFQGLKPKYEDMRLHMIGPLQSNKVKDALKIFDYFHSLDRDSLAKEFSKYPENTSSKAFFIQVNTGLEKQKSGINPNLTSEFALYCLHDLNLNVIGFMCLPPINDDPKEHFLMLSDLASKSNFKQLSMGMSNDYKIAIECGATFIRIGSSFFDDNK